MRKLRSALLQAWRGKREWEKIERQFKLVKDYAILCVGDKEVEKAVFSYLPEFMEKKYANRVLIIISGDAPPLADKRINVLSMEQSSIDAIVGYYRLNHFYDYIIVPTLRPPFGSRGLLEKDNISLENIVKDYIMV